MKVPFSIYALEKGNSLKRLTPDEESAA